MTCLVCGSNNLSLWADVSDSEYFTTVERFTYNRCGECNALSINPVPEDQLGTIYPANYYSFSPVGSSLVTKLKIALDRRLFRGILKPIVGNELSALDIGGGSGWLLTQARKIEPRLSFTMVVDIDSGAESIARNSGHEFFCGRIEDFNSTLRFDLILMLNLIEHVKDPVGVLKAASRLLKPGGRILLKTPNYDSLDARLFRSSYWGGLHCPRHWVLFTPKSLRQAVAATDLKIHDISLTQGAPFWAWSFLHLLHRAGLVRIDRDHPMCYHSLIGPLQAIFAAFDFLRMPFSTTSQMFVVLRRESVVISV